MGTAPGVAESLRISIMIAILVGIIGNWRIWTLHVGLIAMRGGLTTYFIVNETNAKLPALCIRSAPFLPATRF